MGSDGSGSSNNCCGQQEQGKNIIKADLSKENAGELLLHNLRINMIYHPYLSDLVKERSSFSNQKNLIEYILFDNSSFSEKGYVNIAGDSNVELQIIQHGWVDNAETQLSNMIQIKNKNTIKIRGYAGTNVIIFNFGNNKVLFNNIVNYLGGGDGPKFYYQNPYH